MSDKTYGRYKLNEPIFKDYILKSFLGKGQYSYVYLVANKDRTMALKVLNDPVDWDSDQEKGENRGVKFIKDIQSSHLVNILDFGQTIFEDSCVLMEFIKDTLGKVIEKKTKLDEDTACLYFTEILKDLNDLEKYGVIHRDIKPANLFIYSGTIKIGDYSFARVTSGSIATMSGDFGTPAYYSAPEVFDERYSHAADWWASGAVWHVGFIKCDLDGRQYVRGVRIQTI